MRKHTIWNFCETHADRKRSNDPRRFNFVTEGGPAELDSCFPHRCVVKPGRDYFADHVTDETMRRMIAEWNCNTAARALAV